MHQIDFITNHDQPGIFGCIIPDLWNPQLKLLKGSLISYIINCQDDFSIIIIYLRNRTISLLSCRIPNLQGNFSFISQLMLFLSKDCPRCRLQFTVKRIEYISINNTGLTHSWMPDDSYFHTFGFHLLL